MRDLNEELEKRLSGMTEVPFTSELHQRILQKAATQPTTLKHRKRRWDWKSAAAVLGGVAAVVCLGVVGLSPNERGKSTPSPGVTMGVRNVFKSPGLMDSVALTKSPLVVKSVSAKYNARTRQVIVQADLQNQGRLTIKPSDVFGILSFQTKSNGNLLLGANWVSFVNPPKEDVLPGERATWEFQPVGLENPQNINATLRPTLQFFSTVESLRSSTDLVWQGAQGVNLSHIEYHLRQQWIGGQSIEVRALLENHSKQSLPLDDFVAILWYGDDWRKASNLRFLDHIRAVDDSKTEISPGTSVEVYFRLVGADQPIMTQENPNIMLMTKSIEFRKESNQ